VLLFNESFLLLFISLSAHSGNFGYTLALNSLVISPNVSCVTCDTQGHYERYFVEMKLVTTQYLCKITSYLQYIALLIKLIMILTIREECEVV